MKIIYKKKFINRYKKLDKKIQKSFQDRLNIFIENPENTLLRNHKLHGNLNWYNSINITWDYRAIFREIWKWHYEFVEFTDIWTHSQLY